MVEIFIMMNNYFHDLATALLLTSGIAVYVLAKSAEAKKDRSVIEFYVEAYGRMTVLGRIAFGWIIVAGAPRLITFKNYEWVSYVGNNQVPAIMVKHTLMFLVVGAGIFYWRR